MSRGEVELPETSAGGANVPMRSASETFPIRHEAGLRSSIDESDCSFLLDAASAMQRTRDPKEILRTLAAAIRVVAGAGVWLAVGETAAQEIYGQPPGGPTEPPTIDIASAPESWSARLGRGQRPFEANAVDSPIALHDPLRAPDAVTIFPMQFRASVAGLVVGRPLLELPPAERSVIGLLCHEASLALDVGPVSEAAEHTEALFQTLTQLTASYSDPQRVLDTIVRRTAELLGMDAAWIRLADDQKDSLTLTSAFGITADSFAHAPISVRSPLPGAAIRQRRAVCLRDARRDERLPTPPKGVRAVMCAPMFVEDELVGLLVAADRKAHDCSVEDRRIMEALASAAALSIANARLYSEREDYSLALRRSRQFQNSLTALMLAGGGLDEIIETIARTLNCGVFVLDRDLTVLHSSPVHDDGDPGREPAALAAALSSSEEIVAGTGIARIVVPGGKKDVEISVAPLDLEGERTAFVVVAAGASGLRGVESEMVEAAVTTIGLELMRDRAAGEVEVRLAGGLFGMLLSNEGIDEAKIKRRASHLGYELSGANIVIAVAPPEDHEPDDFSDLGGLRTTIQRCLRRHQNPPTAVFEHEEAVYVLLSDPEAVPPALVREHCDLITAELRASKRFAGARVAFAGPHSGIAGVRRAAEQVAHALNVLRVVDKGGTAVAFDDLGIWTLLGSMGDRERLLTFTQDVLGDLIAHDEERQGHLVETVRALAASRYQVRSTAESLGIHVNTLRRRIERISELTGLDFGDPEDRLKADVAIRIAAGL